MATYVGCSGAVLRDWTRYGSSRMIPRPILHELAFLVTFMGWLGLAMLAGSLGVLVVAGGYAAWWIAR